MLFTDRYNAGVLDNPQNSTLNVLERDQTYPKDELKLTYHYILSYDLTFLLSYSPFILLLPLIKNFDICKETHLFIRWAYIRNRPIYCPPGRGGGFNMGSHGVLLFSSHQESTRINHFTVRCVMSAWTNVLKENISAERILAMMNAVSAWR